MGKRFLGLVMLTLMLLIPLTLGQDGASVIEPLDDTMVNPDANISFPPPVYMVRDSIDIRGTVNLPNMNNYLVEFRPLDLSDMEEDEEEAPWFPATLPQRSAVVDDILGTWNTLTARDGLYELRMTIHTNTGPEYVRLSPIRVENNPPAFVEQAMQVEVQPAEESEPVEILEPTPEPVDDTPRVVSLVNSNVRAGDSTNYQIVGFLLEGESAEIRGVSSRGSGWFFVQLANGRSGFIHPGIVRTEGDVGGLRLINPPPLPPTPIPPPVVVAPPVEQQPQTGADLVFGGSKIEPHPATCNKAYKITVTVRNAGNGNSSSGGLIEVRDTREADGSGRQSTHIAFGPLAAGASQTVFGHLTTNQYYNETHHINLYLDVNNQVPETNESNNHHAEVPYVLQRGKC